MFIFLQKRNKRKEIANATHVFHFSLILLTGIIKSMQEPMQHKTPKLIATSGVKIYVTMNTIVFEAEMEDMKAQLHKLNEIGVRCER